MTLNNFEAANLFNSASQLALVLKSGREVDFSEKLKTQLIKTLSADHEKAYS